MVNGVAKLSIDFGNSSTRLIARFGNTQKGNPRSKLVEVSNAFAQMSEDQASQFLADDTYTEEDSRIFRTAAGDVYCNGRICEEAFERTKERPTANIEKYKSYLIKLAVMNAFCKGYETIAEFTNSDIESLDIEWEVVTLLPPEDMEAGSAAITEVIRDIKEIEFLMPSFKKEIRVNSVKVFPEGLAAFIATVFEGVGKIRKDYQYLVDPHATTLIADIGAGTTDFMLVRSAKVIPTSRFTRKTGGNNVHQAVRRLMRAKGIPMKDSVAREGCEQGFIWDGADKVSIVEEIAQAKREVSRDLVDALVEFFESTMIELHSVNYFLIVGGGAESSNVEGVEPISNYLFEYISSISPKIKLVEMPELKDGDETSRMSVRMANIIGADILAG